MSVATRQRPSSPTPPSPAYDFHHFRPIRYQTKEDIDRFFGTTSAQRREQRLRVREADGHVYFDWIEKDEWQHLLATGTLTSPSSPDDARRRSSGMTCLTLGSPLGEASWAGRRASSAGGVSPLSGTFERVRIEDDERRGRKRTSSALAGRKTVVDDGVPLGADWMSAPAFKRRQSDALAHSPRSSFCAPDERIRIARLPLRKLDAHTLDQAFSARKPATLHIPDILHATQLDTSPSPTESSYATSPALLAPTFDSAPAARRGTFGSMLPLQQQAVEMRRVSDATPPPSAMEFLASPAPGGAFGVQPARAGRLRHAASFDTPSAFALDTHASSQWAQRQRWHSAESPAAVAHERQLRSVRSVTSLRDTPRSAVVGEKGGEADLERRRRISTSSDSSASEGCYTPLAPRVGAKKFDRTRMLHLADAGSATKPSVELLPMRDPVSLTTTTTTTTTAAAADIVTLAAVVPTQVAPRTGTHLRTGPEVYLGIDIPCASIHLHSDPEDNVEPALALSMSASKLRKLKKAQSASADDDDAAGPAGHLRRAASSVSHSSAVQRQPGQGQGYAKGSSRWWSHILG
ncbi:conserved hypothetical protein [Sporisorium reilianum SRZ2]|uniref:Uncharacterized protein n=1 Tax=Sporisorium reilianum (strain SRZ2) TaxID=999809 RepID=E6ZSC7_SPORE|nr:conserved hypothetical protein [Sporisorium reilianum SRZ2]